MEIKMDITPSLKEMEKVYKDLGEKEIKKATAKAMNLIQRGLVTKTAATIGGAHGRYKVRSSDVKKDIRKYRANPAELRMYISLTSRRLRLYQFNAKQQGRLKNRKVKATIIRGKRKEIRKAFIATMKSGHTGVFKRVGKKRFPIKELYTISVAEMASARKVYAVIQKFLETETDKRVNQAFRETMLRMQGRLAKRRA